MLNTNTISDIATVQTEIDIVSVKMLQVVGIDTTPLTFKVRRRLFGCCNDSESSVSEALAELETEDVQRSSQVWNFDFSTDSPLPGGRYAWEKVRNCDVPVLYTSEDSCNDSKRWYVSRLSSQMNILQKKQIAQADCSECQQNQTKSLAKSSKRRLVQTSIKGYAKIQKKRSSNKLFSKRASIPFMRARVANFILNEQAESASS